MISSRLADLDIIGVHPNGSMKQNAVWDAEKSGLLASHIFLRIVYGVPETLPYPDASADAVV